MAIYKNLDKTVLITIDGTDRSFKMNFTDKRFLSKLLKLVNKYRSFDDRLKTIVDQLQAEAEQDEVQAGIKLLDQIVAIEEEFKADVNDCFGQNVTDIVFGEGSLPDIQDYAEFFEQIEPLIADARKMESEKLKSVLDKYGVQRITK